MTNELTDVRCPCGTEFPAESYDAGFIAGSGMCQNCDAALPPKDICTCPSGDGSLRHPCPAHPAPVEQAGGDERAAFFKHLIGRHPAHETEIVRVVEHNYAAWKAWQARAVLAQPSPAPADEKPGDSILCSGCFAKGVGPEHFDEAGKCLVRQQTEPLGAERARVVVVPERKSGQSTIPGLHMNRGWNACLDELARLNGLTVSEGLLRRLARPADRYDEVFTLDRHEAAEELRALLSEQEGGRQ
ncbi:hypothetical protein ACT51S_07215 [Pseudomonas aeruginosa]